MFKKLIAAAAALVMVGAAPAFAQKVAYYDHAEVIAQSNAWKALQAELKTKGAEVSAQLQPMADELNKEASAIEQLVSGKKPEQLSDAQKKQVGEFQQKRAALAAGQQRVTQEFAIIRELAEVKLNKAINDSLADVAKSKKVDVLMREQPLGYYNTKYDATSEVLASVNRKVSTLSVDGLIDEAQKQAAAAN